MAYEFRFPDVGEGITEGELLSWKVKEGDLVAEDQPLAELETDKAVVDLPSPRAGRVARLHAAEGDIVKVGDVVVTIEEAAAAAGVAAPTREATAPPETAAPPQTTGPPGTAAPREAPTIAPSGPTAPAEDVVYTSSVVGRLEEAPDEQATRIVPAPRPSVAEAERPSPAPSAAGQVLAMPSVRALARELGVDLDGIRGTGPGGRILKQDVEDVAEAAAYGVAASAAPSLPSERPAPQVPEAAVPHPAAAPPAPPARPSTALAPIMGGTIEQDAFGPVERVLFRGVRRSMAKRMAEAVAKQAQVTTMDDADVTVIRHIREKERGLTEERGVRLTYLAFVVKACTAALRRFPRLNAVLDESGDEFVLKRYCNVGIAIDTKAGLVVPNIKAADQKSIFTIAEEIVDLVRRADARSLSLQDFHGGTFTISNYGAVGSTFATPVINYPEVALLGVGRGRDLPVVRDGNIAIRLMLPLSLTIDHRLIDGAEATRFLNTVIGYLEDPDLLLLEGD